MFGPGAIAPIVFEGVGFARRHRADQRVDLGFWQIGELFEQGGGHLFALLFFARPDPVDLVDQPLPRIVAAAGYSPDRVDALVWAFTELLVERMPGENVYELYRQWAIRRAAQQATTCSNRAPARLGGVVPVVGDAEQARLNHGGSRAEMYA
jgi:hypothetical protein